MNAPPVLRSPLLADLPGVDHAFFTRRGGVSEGAYQSLNVGRGSRDDPAAVAENRRLAALLFGREPETLNTAYQVHSARALIAERAWGEARPRGDAVVTNRPGLICGALAADCAPVLIADGQARVVAAVHAGWRGALAGVVRSAIEAMVGLGASPERMVGVVGPCISQASYEVGLEFAARFEAVSPGWARYFTAATHADRRWFDLPGFVLSRLKEAGVKRCEWIGRDTCAEAADFFSNRRSFLHGESDYGRLLSAIVLEDPDSRQRLDGTCRAGRR
ncbi:MAG: peptidoglycan editing factor PgeF [Caulobacteraceae bacterium]